MQGQTPSYVLTTLLVPPAGRELVTLDAVREELSMLPLAPGAQQTQPSDQLMRRLIRQCSAAIERHCNRTFGLAVWQDEWRLARGIGGEGVREANNPLKLGQWPLAAGPVAFTGNLNATRQVSGIASTQGLAPGQPVFGEGIPAGTVIASVQPYSLTLSQPATTTVSGVALTAGLQVTEVHPDGRVTVLEPGVDYEVDIGPRLPGQEGAARLYRLHRHRNQPRTWSSLKTIVIYQTGYRLPGHPGCGPEVPEDLQEACLRFVTMRYVTRGRDPTMVQWDQPGLGSQRFWVGSQPGQDGALPPEIADMIAPLRVPVVG